MAKAQSSLWITGSTGTNNWFSKLSELLTHVHGGTLHVDALHTDGSVNVAQVPESVWRKHQHTTVWGNLSTDPRTAPGDDVTLSTYHAWFAEPIDLQHSHWRPVSCIRATNIPYSQLLASPLDNISM
jgi:hypothetical protein